MSENDLKENPYFTGEWATQWLAALSIIEQELEEKRNKTIIEIEEQTETDILKDDDV